MRSQGSLEGGDLLAACGVSRSRTITAYVASHTGETIVSILKEEIRPRRTVYRWYHYSGLPIKVDQSSLILGGVILGRRHKEVERVQEECSLHMQYACMNSTQPLFKPTLLKDYVSASPQGAEG